MNPLLTCIHVQFSSVAVVSDSLRPHESQHGRPPCPSPTPGVYSNSCPLSWRCHPAISSSIVPFSSCPRSLPASESFPMSQLFASAGQSIGVSALASVLPMSTQDWSPWERAGWLEVKNSPANARDIRDVDSIPRGKDSLEKEMASHSSVLARRIHGQKSPAGYDWSDLAQTQLKRTKAWKLGLWNSQPLSSFKEREKGAQARFFLTLFSTSAPEKSKASLIHTQPRRPRQIPRVSFCSVIFPHHLSLSPWLYLKSSSQRTLNTEES